MESIREILWFGLKACLYCGSLFPNDGGLCDRCADSLWSGSSEDDLYTQTLDKFEAVSLFQWIPDEQEVLSRLVHALKGRGGQELWDYYAEEFWKRLLTDPHYQPRKGFVFIPSPARKAGTVDHAAQFARSLAALSGGSVCFCLSRGAPQRSQKKRSRHQRFKTELQWTENFSPEVFQTEYKGRQIVFVDDIVTTGATATAAWRALGKSRDFAVWALAQRGLPCRVLGDLV